MRENRPSGSEGGGTSFSLPLSAVVPAAIIAGETPAVRAPGSAHVQRGASPLQADALRPETNCNCGAAMCGGEQQEVNDQSVG